MAQELKGIDWMVQLEAATLTTAPASDAENRTGTATDVACTPASMMAALAALAFPIAMTKAGLFSLGTLSSANDTSGVALSSSKTAAMRICADTGGAALTSGFERAIQGRFLLGTAITSGADISAAGIEGLLKMIVSVNVGGNHAGIMGHLESAGTLTLTGSINVVKAGVASFVDLATGATIAASTVVSAFGVNPASFGTVTGRTAIVHVTAPNAGAWGALFDLSGNQGIATSAAGSTNDKFGVIYVDGTKYTFPLSKA
jgi:hypothetical protein